MKKILLFNLLLLSGVIFGQTSGQNYIYSKTYLSEDGSKKSEAVQYFDGLGRLKQTVSVQSTVTGKDLVVPVYYDELGRQNKDFLPLPMATSNLGIQTVSEADINSYYGVSNAYSEKISDDSPLGQILETAKPGDAWKKGSGHTQKFDYQANTDTDEVKKYVFTSSWSNATISFSVPTVGWYSENQLMKNITTDEDGNKRIDFKNSQGQIVLARKMSGATPVDTYYLYNIYDQLVLVITPKADKKISQNGNVVTQTILDEYCYQYKYDHRNRMVEKRLPGKDFWEYFVYDKQNRLVLSQDANQHLKQWSFVKYDQFGRTVYAGLFANTSGRAAMQATLNTLSANAMNNESRSTASFTSGGQAVYYTKAAFPTENITVLTVSYYDDYVPGAPARPATVLGKPTLAAAATVYTSNGIASYRSLKGMPTSSFIKNIEDDLWTQSHIWYDKDGRAVGSHSVNHLGGYTKTETDMDFAGVVKQTKIYHKRLNADTERTITQTFEYDSQNRLLVHKHKVDARPEEVLAQNTYNDLGQVTEKKVGNNIAAPLQTVKYTYNIHGSLIRINDPAQLGNDLFGYKINYSEVEGLETPNTDFPELKVKARYNGNIAEVSWKTASAANEPLRRYGYTYDDLNRLSAGFYQNSNYPSSKEYFEKIDYDIDGSIQRLKRSDRLQFGAVAQLIDNLKYEYEGTRLTKVTDEQQNASGYPYVSTPNTIAYDANGNMTSQQDKDITSIQYNFLNLAYEIDAQNSVISPYQLEYIYRADGVKLTKKYKIYDSYYPSGFTESTTDYIDGFQYVKEDANSAVVLKFVPTSEGYYNFENNKYIYNYSDHLGNIRLGYQKGSNGSAEVLEENNYYPFGLKHSGYDISFGNFAYNYKYNGKELQESGMYDYGARMYMPDLGRWGVVDPLAEVTPHLSPYHYANNNPIMFNDPTGMLSQSFMDEVWGSPSGTTWTNTGDGFTNNWGGTMDYSGSSMNYKSYSALAANMGAGGGGGSGSVGGSILLPSLHLGSWKSSFAWGYNSQQHHNSFMDRWNAKSDFAWDRTIHAGRYNDGPVKMIGGFGDPAGLFDIGGQVISNWEPQNRYLAMGAGIIGAIALKKPGLIAAEEKATYYSVAYEMKLAEGSYPGVYRGGHFREANKMLESAMLSDTKFASGIENLGIVIPRSPAGSILGKSPTNWVWHHHVDEGIMQLVPKPQHTVGSSFWSIMHPGNKGGFAIWGK